MKKTVLKFDSKDGNGKQKALQTVAGVRGVDSVAVDKKNKRVTVTGKADPVRLTEKLRTIGNTELLRVGPVTGAKKESSGQERNRKVEKDRNYHRHEGKKDIGKPRAPEKRAPKTGTGKGGQKMTLQVTQAVAFTTVTVKGLKK